VTKSLWLKRAKLSTSFLAELPVLEPTPRPPHNTTVTYPFATKPWLKEEYRNPWGNLRVGRLLEDLDSLAGNIAYRHWSVSRVINLLIPARPLISMRSRRPAAKGHAFRLL